MKNQTKTRTESIKWQSLEAPMMEYGNNVEQQQIVHFNHWEQNLRITINPALQRYYLHVHDKTESQKQKERELEKFNKLLFKDPQIMVDTSEDGYFGCGLGGELHIDIVGGNMGVVYEVLSKNMPDLIIGAGEYVIWDALVADTVSNNPPFGIDKDGVEIAKNNRKVIDVYTDGFPRSIKPFDNAMYTLLENQLYYISMTIKDAVKQMLISKNINPNIV